MKCDPAGFPAGFFVAGVKVCFWRTNCPVAFPRDFQAGWALYSVQPNANFCRGIDDMVDWKKILLSGAFAVASSPALAEVGEWQYEGALYLFAAETDLSVGDLDATLSFSDALDNLDMAGMGAFAASNGQWTFVADLMYFDLGFSEDRDAPIITGVDADVKMTVFNVAGYYRVHETPTSWFDVGAGFRYFDTENEIELETVGPNRPSQSADDSWTDPVIAARANFEFSDKWSMRVVADYGSFIDDRETYQVTLSVGYEFAENWSARFGYRYLNVENDDINDFRLEQSGPILGVMYRF